jgi:flagellar hook-associated protein 1 FlgK
MSSLISGIEIAMKSLRANTIALNTITHNVANATNTDYSRQLADISATEALSIPGTAGQLGTGSAVSYIERMKDIYLQKSIDAQLSVVGKDTVLDSTYQTLANIFTEASGTTTTGIQSKLDAFYSAWQDLATAEAAGNTATISADKTAVYSAAASMTEAIKTAYSSLTTVQTSLTDELKDSVTSANSYLKQIYDLNAQIISAYASGQQPNDLLDKRDAAIAGLSSLINVTVNNKTDGSVVVMTAGNITLVNGGNGYSKLTTSTRSSNDSKSERLAVYQNGGGQPVVIDSDEVTGGKIAGILEARDTVVQGYKIQLDDLASSMIYVVNKFYKAASGSNFFTDSSSTAANISLNSQLDKGQNIVDSLTNGTAGDLADILGSLGNKIINNSVTSSSPSLYNANSQLGVKGTLLINNSITVSFETTTTVQQLVNSINASTNEVSAVYDDATKKFFMVGNGPITITETDAVNPSVAAVMSKLKLEEQQISTAPIDYQVTKISNNDTWKNQEYQLNLETTTSGTVTVNYQGVSTDVTWSDLQRIKITMGNIAGSFDMQFTDGTGNSTTTDVKKISLASKIAGTTLSSFTVTDKSGNLMQSLGFVGNETFDEAYSSLTTSLSSATTSADDTLSADKASLTQLQAQETKITSVDETEELAQAKIYQRAYDASVKLMDIIDEMLNVLINKTGTSSSSISSN